MQLHHKLLEKTLSSEMVFDGALLKVFKDTAQLPNETGSVREWIKHPGACAVVPLFENGDVMLVKQFRYPSSQIFLELPAGKIDEGEPQEITAVRELQEEVGLTCDNLYYLGHQYPCIGYSDEIIHYYVASSLHKVLSNTDHDEFVELYRLPFDEAVEWVHQGIINDGKTVIGLLRTERWLKNR